MIVDVCYITVWSSKRSNGLELHFMSERTDEYGDSFEVTDAVSCTLTRLCRHEGQIEHEDKSALISTDLCLDRTGW